MAAQAVGVGTALVLEIASTGIVSTEGVSTEGVSTGAIAVVNLMLLQL